MLSCGLRFLKSLVLLYSFCSLILSCLLESSLFTLNFRFIISTSSFSFWSTLIYKFSVTEPIILSNIKLWPSSTIAICLVASLSITTWAPIGTSYTRFFAAYILTLTAFEEIDSFPKKLSIVALKTALLTLPLEAADFSHFFGIFDLATLSELSESSEERVESKLLNW